MFDMSQLRFGGIGGFLTPNVADTRNPLVVVLHAGCVAHPDGGFTKEGETEKFQVSLLDENPSMPTASRMLEMLAENPVAQARFFILSMRLFLQHVLGIAAFDPQLRANGTKNGVEFPDGCIASFTGGSFAAIAHLHGPIEEQARLACHPHIVLHFVNRMSQAWLKGVLRRETSEAKSLLRSWQQQTLLAVESLMSSCAGLLPLHFREAPFPKIDLQSLPYLTKWQAEDKYDGELEDCKKYPEKRRDLVPVQAAFVDLHMRRPEEDAAAAGDVAGTVSARKLPLTGSVMSRLPHYRLLPGGFAGCECSLCCGARTGLRKISDEEFIDASCADFMGVCALSGHLHEHQATCFKYAPEGSRRKPQHCRFNFVHFVKLFREKNVDAGFTSFTKLIEVVVARTGKPLLLPRWLTGQPSGGLRGEDFAGRFDLGSTVDTSSESTQRGRVRTVQYNPREGQCYPVSS